MLAVRKLLIRVRNYGNIDRLVDTNNILVPEQRMSTEDMGKTSEITINGLVKNITRKVIVQRGQIIYHHHHYHRLLMSDLTPNQWGCYPPLWSPNSLVL